LDGAGGPGAGCGPSPMRQRTRWASSCVMASTSQCMDPATRRRPRSGRSAVGARMLLESPPFPRQLPQGPWAWKGSAFRASPTWRPVCSRSRSCMRKSLRRHDGYAGRSFPCSRASLSASKLVSAARRARRHAHAAYSNFKVGAALETSDGTIITGCNVENATYGLTICAERVAMFKALSEGHPAFTRIAVVADTKEPTPPCGSCRQLLWEYCGDIDVILGNLESMTGKNRLASLLPRPFDRRLL